MNILHTADHGPSNLSNQDRNVSVISHVQEMNVQVSVSKQNGSKSKVDIKSTHMNIIPFKGKNTSTHYNLNLLFNEGKTYLMDNHLAASWCWMQKLDPTKQYNLFHIDRHYDLLNSQTDWWIAELQRRNFDFKTISINDLLAITYSSPDFPRDKFQLFRWDNYLTILNRIYPTIIGSATFATHKDGDAIEELDIHEEEIYELPGNLSYWINERNRWIVNIDIDYFFTDKNGEYFQFLTDTYVRSIAEEIKKSWAILKF
jgi:hypothetical protein